MRFVAVGDVMIDVLAEGAGHDARIDVRVGGSAPNAARWALVAGAQPGVVVGRVGDDAAGRMVEHELTAAGVQASLSVDPERHTGTFLRVDGEVRADRGANASLRPAHLPPLEAGAVLVSGYLPADTVGAALERARARWVALDAGRLEALPPGGNVLLANETAARRLGIEDERTLARLPYEWAVVTRGERGALVAAGDELARVEPEEAVPGDALGAGDAFAAGLLVALANGVDAAEALARATRLSARAAAEARP